MLHQPSFGKSVFTTSVRLRISDLRVISGKRAHRYSLSFRKGIRLQTQQVAFFCNLETFATLILVLKRTENIIHSA